MSRCIIAGSRTINEQKIVDEVMDDFHYYNPLRFIHVVISGGAGGVDRLGEVWARRNNCSIHQETALWNHHGRGAGVIRNGKMADMADMCIVIMEDDSKGSKNMIEQAVAKGIFTRVYRVYRRMGRYSITCTDPETNVTRVL